MNFLLPQVPKSNDLALCFVSSCLICPFERALLKKNNYFLENETRSFSINIYTKCKMDLVSSKPDFVASRKQKGRPSCTSVNLISNFLIHV